MLEAIIDTLVPFLPGYLELPASYVGLLKGATHKYIKRVPKAGGGYRYFYHVGHGGGVQMEEHFVPGASFQHEGGHYHIKSAEGGKLVIEHDETKERKTVSKAELRDMLGAHHEPAIKAHREKVAGMLAEAKANKASPKQIARLEARAKAVGVQSGPKAETHTERMVRLGIKDKGSDRNETLRQAHEAGASDATMKKLGNALRVGEGEHVVIPPHSYETMSRGRGWARQGQGKSAKWGDRVSGGYRVGPGSWTIGGHDGFSRKDEVGWDVSHVRVGPHTWTVAD